MWKGTTDGTTSNAKGQFNINRSSSSDTLVISFVGYKTTKIYVSYNDWEVMAHLENSAILDDVVVGARYQSLGRTDGVALGQKITHAELKKAACCNLSESFETNPSVDINFADAISGAKRIQMLGLDGVYSLITTENIPSIRGLSSNFGLNSIPGSWIRSIQLAKGVGSVINGYESTTGQINVELKRPSESPSYHLNTYINHLLRVEATADHNIRLNDNWSTGLMVHGSNYGEPIDANSDGFRDLPNSQQINMSNRWDFYNGKIESKMGVRYMAESRTGGAMAFNRSQNIADNLPYGVMIDITRADVHAKMGILPNDEHENRSVGFIADYTFYAQQSLYGLKYYDGAQHYGYFSSIFQDNLKWRGHSIKTGINLVVDDYTEIFDDQLNGMDTTMKRKELVAGAFGEYTYNPNIRFSTILGFRLDYHNLFGVIPTPRLHLRYKLRKNLSWRFAGGTGFRYPNVLVDNSRTMASSRRLVFREAFKPERALNLGTSLVWDFEVNKNEGALVIDLYRTQFQNQVIMDMDIDPYELHFYNLEGESYANVVQVDLNYDLTKRLSARLSYKYQDVQATMGGYLQSVPFVARNKFFSNLAYENKSGKWKFDVTALRTDIARLPHSHERPVEFQWPHESQPFWRINGQITRDLGGFEIYLGGENLTNYTQNNPIVSVENPFNQNFDAANVWAPIYGRIIYAGLRLTVL